jgi:hypothetical protein
MEVFFLKKLFISIQPNFVPIVAILAKASASFLFSFANTFSGAPATNFRLPI